MNLNSLVIGAHQDDLEFMACSFIFDKSFGGIVCTDGRSSVRGGEFAQYTDQEISNIRLQEQEQAAVIGEYDFISQYCFESKMLKEASTKRNELVDRMSEDILRIKPRYLVTHNPFDRHATHRIVFKCVLQALANLKNDFVPEFFWGGELWGGLDWIPESHRRIRYISSEQEKAMRDLAEVFSSQISDAKNYANAVLGRKLSNATFLDPYSRDQESFCELFLCQNELIGERSIDLEQYCENILSSFKNRAVSEAILSK